MKKIDNDEILKTLDFGLDSPAVSHQETTGLIPFAPIDENAIHSYMQIDKYRQNPIV